MVFRVGLDEHCTMIISRRSAAARGNIIINAFLEKFGLIFIIFFGIVQTNRRLWKIFNIQNRRILLY